MHIRSGLLKFSGILVLLPLFFLKDVTCCGSDSLRIRIMFYNCENMFDTFNDPDTDDDDFLPEGLMRWTFSRYTRKVNNIAKTIIAAGEWFPPDIVAMCEIENRRVAEDIVSTESLARCGYGIVHEESPDPRGIDVCMIYRKESVRILKYSSLKPEIADGEFHSRSIMYIKCLLHGDTIHLLLNHWPSRRGGVLAAGDLRKKISIVVGSFADSLMRLNRLRQKIIIAGDFNCEPDDKEIQSLIVRPDGRTTGLINLAGRNSPGSAGTYRFQGSWELFDQIIISEGLLNCMSGLYADKGSFTIFDPAFLLKSDPKYPGTTPFSTYRGYRYQGGFSDHLPVIVDLGFR